VSKTQKVAYIAAVTFNVIYVVTAVTSLFYMLTQSVFVHLF